MGTYTAYRLKFKTQLHLGRSTGAAQTGSLGLEKTEIYIPADTLFSALCQTWATFYDTSSLTDFLNQYTAENESLPFTLTSVFPFGYDTYLFPKPLRYFHTETEGRSDLPVATIPLKKIKNVQYVSHSVFQDIISGNPPDFDENNLINSEKVWVSPDEKAQLREKMAIESNVKTEEIKKENIDIWKTATRPRVTIDRQTDESSIWHVQTVQFNTNCGLWFAVNYNTDATKEKIETLLRVLGDCGIGGERNAGYGLFDFKEVDLEIPSAEDTTQFVTLSPVCPNTPDQLAHILTGDIAYDLNPLTGWIGSPGTHTRRNRVNMFAEGSVLNASEERIGRLVDLKPDGWTHPVYRYGYAWQVGIKGTSA